MVFTFNAACGSFLGVGRSNNEDNFFFHNKHLPVPNKGLDHPLYFKGTTEDPVAFAVFDGMGGECNGEEAARISCEAFSDEYRKLEELAVSGKVFLYECCDKANAAVNRYKSQMQLSSTGSTFAAVYFSNNEVVACNVGDSRIFRIRDKKMLQISEDHTDEKIISAMGLSKKPVLLQYIGIPDTQMALEPYISKGDIASGDVYVLCSDGVTDAVNVGDLYEIVGNYGAEESVEKILTEVERRKGADNATVIVVKIA